MSQSSRAFGSVVVLSVIALIMAVFPLAGLAATAQVQLTASDGAPLERLGVSVAISGDTAIAGSLDAGAGPHQGAAYVFTHNGETWTQQAKLVASDGAALDRFSYNAVAVSGDTALVGAMWDDDGVNPDRGSAYVFTRSGTTWTQQAKLTASDGAAQDNFGFSVALSGDTAVIGAYWDDEGFTHQGSTYVFTRSGTTWTQQEKLTAPVGVTDQQFGYSVAVSDDTVLVGAVGDRVGANDGQGSAYVFTRTGTDWTQEAQLVADDGATGDAAGQAVGLSGDSAVVGAMNDDVGDNMDQGSAYIFARTGTTWDQEAHLTASDGAAADLFGRAAAISGDTALIGAEWDDTDGQENQGSAYIYKRSGATWPEQEKLTVSGATGDLYGTTVAISGGAGIIGASFDDVGINPDQGSVYVFGHPAARATTRVAIDVKPGDGTNRIRTSGSESIAVAALTTTTFDATTIDPSSVCFGDDPPAGGTTSYNQPAGVDADCSEAHRKGHIEDADGDGDLDLVLHFESTETGIDRGDDEARLTGRMMDGTFFEGSDSVRVIR